MRYANASNAEMNFRIGGQTYKVPKGGHCHIPDRYAYAVKEYGLKLEPAGEPDYQPPPVEPPAFEAEDASEEDMLDELTRPDPDPPKKTRGKG